ncbi:MAG TPA: SIMPL domain-containing protein [Acidimicrobiales bacterium]|nr:SIMPL domain-containing protein [Acidimicrobiales bacterium]
MSDHSDSSEERSTNDHDHDHHGPWAPRGSRRGYGPRGLFLLVFAIVVAAIAFTGESLGHHHATGLATITVTGSGTVSGAPNTMSFQIGVQTVASSAQGALDTNNYRVSALEKSLEKNGVIKKNMQTSGLNIYQNTNNYGTVTGYTVDDNLNVSTHDLKKAGAALDAAAHAVGNGIQLSGVTFSISNQSKLLASARARAVKNAHTEAVQIAKGGGTTVESIVKIVDQENAASTGVVYSYGAFAASAPKSSVPIEAGKQSVNVTVTVIYSLSS